MKNVQKMKRAKEKRLKIISKNLREKRMKSNQLLRKKNILIKKMRISCFKSCTTEKTVNGSTTERASRKEDDRLTHGER